MQKSPLNQDEFDRLLRRLDADRDAAGAKYEHIRSALVKIFKRRGCTMAEELADKTIDRVSEILPKALAEYEGDPANFFYGVAKYIYKEWLKEWLRTKGPLQPPPPPQYTPEELEQLDQCLQQCLAKLEEQSRGLIIDYYDYGERGKKEHRRELAQRDDTSIEALRMKASRVRKRLRTCIRECMKGS